MGNYTFVDRDYNCEKSFVISKEEYGTLQATLVDYINSEKAAGRATLVSIYFRDLEDGPTMSIDASTDYVPASLLKLPLAITLMRAADEHPDILNTVINSGDLLPAAPQAFAPAQTVQPNTSYTLIDLIYRALAYSDNLSAQILFESRKQITGLPAPLEQTYRDLGVIDPGTSLDAAVVNAKEYSGILRMLYSVAFLSKDNSEKLLSILSHSQFDQGLRQGVPESITIAHKFGERSLGKGEAELHDCGIIYYPNNPYILCVMTKGTSFSNLATIIGHISTLVYQEVDSRKL